VSAAHGPLFTKPRRGEIAFWAAFAILNLAAGIVLSSQPNRITDLESIMRWTRDWLVNRQNVYHPLESAVDYPPNAIVVLSPLSLLPMGVAVPLWVFCNVIMAFLAPYLAARFLRPHAPFRIIVLPILMFLCWGGMRALTQFSLLALTFAMAALALVDRRPFTGALCLGLALMKPQVALPVVMWTVFTRRWRTAATAAGIGLLLFAIFCVWADDTPSWVLTKYAAILALHHTGEAILAGASELRPLIRQLVSDVSEVDAIAGSIGLGLFAGICVAGVQEGGVRRRVLYAAPALVACWSLMTFYHLTYGFIVLLPLMMLLALNDTEQSPLRRTLFWVLQLGMMFDVPGISRRLGLSDTWLYASFLVHADRMLIVVLFVGLVVLAWSEPPDTEALTS
jgi:hypothetical protein